MPDIRALIRTVAAQEDRLRAACFLAPRVAGGSVRARVGGLVCHFSVEPRTFEGWGIFQAVRAATARLVDSADLPQVAAYLALLAPVRFRLVHPLHARTWLAYPCNESDARQKLGAARPLPIHLVLDAAPFEAVLARWDGTQLWHEDADRRADPRPADFLAEALASGLAPEQLRWKGLTPEMRTAYGIAFGQTEAGRAARDLQRDEERIREALRRGGDRLEQAGESDSERSHDASHGGPGRLEPVRGSDSERSHDASRGRGRGLGRSPDRDEERLREALHRGGGRLERAHDHGDFWTVEWTTRDGTRHQSGIRRRDLTVLSSGICLSGRDRDFDLQSLVGVIEGAGNFD